MTALLKPLRHYDSNLIQMLFHYKNTLIQIYWKCHLKIKKNDIFRISAQNIDCGYPFEPPHRGGSNEYPQSMFLSRNKKK